MVLDVEHLNFHHLRYFWAVATSGNLTRSAARLRVSQSALSSQIQQLEAHLGVALFSREGRGLVLTETGQVVLGHAQAIFNAGTDLLTTLQHGRTSEEVLRLGAVATLSRNFQESFVSPVFGRPGVRLSLESGSLDALVERLEATTLDVVLANRPPSALVADGRIRCRRLARQRISIVGPKRIEHFQFPDGIGKHAMIVPGPASDVRSSFDALCEQHGVRVQVMAEVDDMATMRLLARDAGALALVPSVVVRDELRAGVLHELCVVPDLFESFYAITADRTFPQPLVALLLKRSEADLLAEGASLP